MINPTASKNNQRFRYLSTVFLFASSGYLVYSLYHFEEYDALFSALKTNINGNFSWLIAVVVLLPFNWLMEALKWKRVSRHLEKMKLGKAYKAVLAGTASGFVTPNRIGDIIGRMKFLNSENRKSAFSLALINSLTQNIAILLFGIPLAILFFMQQKTEIQLILYIVVLFATLLVYSLILFYLPQIAKHNKIEWLQPYYSGLSDYATNDVVVITGWSLVRFITFNVQLYCMLGFFGVELSSVHAITAIPVTYLLVTFTPSFAFSEALVRGSWAVFVIGQFASDTPSILMASVGLWLINVILPVTIGNVILALKR